MLNYRIIFATPQLKKSRILTFSVFLFLAIACNNSYKQLEKAHPNDTQIVAVVPVERPWLEKGDHEAGFEYLVNGGYVGSGIPFSYMEHRLNTVDTVLGREGKNEKLTYSFNAFPYENGVHVISGNCFSCHASPFEDSIYFGLGNSFSDFTQRIPGRILNFLIQHEYGKDSEEWEAFHHFGSFYKYISPRVQTEQFGVNTAFRLEEACAAHRNPVELTPTKEAQFPMTSYNIASDVPPLWNFKRKNVLYYNGMGRGDFRKLLQQASMLGVKDSAAARDIFTHFDDVLAWLESLEAPKYPGTIEQAKASEGKMIFEDKCQRCHGRYGPYPSYPNKIVPLDEVGTDPMYALYFLVQSGLPDWYNQSWFALSPPQSQLQPSAGYIAPPLDGVWATAPYLHNGSIPSLADLLYSPQRPKVWKRNVEAKTYDLENMGWHYSIPQNAKELYTFDTNLPSYGNQGHYFADSLSAAERRSLLEYLKTL